MKKLGSLISAVAEKLPTVVKPDMKLNLKSKAKWTFIILIAYFILGSITIWGIDPTAVSRFEFLEIVFGSKFGSIISLGIGPIVTASIVLQLLNGSGLVKFDLTSQEGKKRFQGTQKLVAVGFAFFEGIIYVMSGFVPSLPGFSNAFLLIMQLAFGAIILMYLDEVVNKYGIGSGVGLFIAAGVSFSIIWQAFSWISQPGVGFIGLVPQLFQGLITGNIPETAVFTLLFTIS